MNRLPRPDANPWGWRLLHLALGCAAMAAAPVELRGQTGEAVATSGAAARLAASAGDLFPAETVADAVMAGVAGARLGASTERQRALGLQEGDVIVAVDGQALASAAWTAPAAGEHVFTVLRHLTGERPVLAPEIVGRQVLEQFVTLPESQRSPMRLTRMLANQQMLMQEGVGLFLVPATANQDDATWLAKANPLPEPWEAAVRAVRDAVQARVQLPVSGNEAQAATRLLSDGEYLEASERAQRAILVHVAVPERRADQPDFTKLLSLYQDAEAGMKRERRELLDPGGRFAIVLEPLFSRSATPLPQDILMQVERSNDFLFAAGLNTSLHWPSPSGGWPVFRDLDLLVEYGYTSRSYEGPHGDDELPIGEGVEPPVTERLGVTEHRVSFELTYRPTLAARFRPMLRGGPAFFRSTASSFDQNGVETMRVAIQSWGWVAGGGIDVYNQRQIGLRATLVATVQQVEQEFCDDAVFEFGPPRVEGSWERASNILQFKRDEMRPNRGVCRDGTAFYRLESSAWHAGVMLAYEF